MLESDKAALAAVLAWYRAMGADEAVGEAPVDWLDRGEAAPGGVMATGLDREESRVTQAAPASASPSQAPMQVSVRPQPPPAGAPTLRQFPTGAPEAAVMAARTAAREAATLEDLARRLSGFEGCGLKATAKNLCFYRGMPQARLMLIGEAPGRDEDIEGKPFVGRAGQLLDRMLAAIGLGEEHVHITNIVYWRPPGNRTPTPQEAQVCRPFLERQVELVAPDFVVLLGGAAAKHLLEIADGIMRIRGTWRDIEIGAIRARAMATLHPAYLLRTPAAKRLAWRDLLAIKAALSG